MGVLSEQERDRRAVRIRITGRFDFSVQGEFRDAYRAVNTKGVVFRVNMASTDYMDSSALGMLLLLREHVEALQGKVIIESPSVESARILRIAKFDQLFSLEG